MGGIGFAERQVLMDFKKILDKGPNERIARPAGDEFRGGGGELRVDRG